MQSTAVVPFFKVTRGLTLATYRCRACGWTARFEKHVTRDMRMIGLAQHVADMHQTGPLMPSRNNAEVIA